jgi:hypothetical protein
MAEIPLLQIYIVLSTASIRHSGEFSLSAMATAVRRIGELGADLKPPNEVSSHPVHRSTSSAATNDSSSKETCNRGINRCRLLIFLQPSASAATI